MKLKVVNKLKIKLHTTPWHPTVLLTHSFILPLSQITWCKWMFLYLINSTYLSILHINTSPVQQQYKRNNINGCQQTKKKRNEREEHKQLTSSSCLSHSHQASSLSLSHCVYVQLSKTETACIQRKVNEASVVVVGAVFLSAYQFPSQCNALSCHHH